MKKCIITFLLLVVLAPSIYAQSTANYTFSSVSNGNLIDMSSGTANLLTIAYHDDDASSVTNIGFTFYFMGTAYTQFSINSNGQIRLGSTAISGTAVVPEANVPYLAPIGGNNAIMSSGKVHYKVTGTTPNQILIIEWVDLRIANPNWSGAFCTLQALLYEGSSKIEYAYGSMFNNGTSESRTIFLSSSNTASGTVGSVDIGAAPTFTTISATPFANSLADSSAIVDLNSTSNGSRWIYTFTPPSTPAAPTNITGTNITNNSLTLGWTDNSTTEIYFTVYISTDGGTNYSLYNTVTSTTRGTTGTLYSTSITGLASQFTYYFRVTATNEGSASTPLQGFFTTKPVVSVKTGNWSDPTTWNTGLVPIATDTVTIANGHSVTIDVAAVCYLLTVGQGTSGILEFEQTTARTLTVGGKITVSSGGIFRSNTAGTQTGHMVSLGGNLTNNGTIDFSTNGNTAGAGITFTGASNATFDGTGTTTDLLTLTVNKGVNSTPILDITLINAFTVQGANTLGFLTLTNGTLRISGGFTQSNPVFTSSAYTIPASAGFWLNNPNFTVTGQNNSATNNGLLRITAGTYDVGTAVDNSLGFGTGAVFTVEGGTLNVQGALNTTNAIIATISSGIINIAKSGNSTASPSFGLTSASNSINFTSGTINIIQANTNGSPIDYNVAGTITNFTNTINFGTSATSTNFVFRAQGQLPNVLIDNTTFSKTLTIVGTDLGTTFRGNLTNSGTLNLNGLGVNFNGNITNNGTLNGTTALSKLRFTGSSEQTFSGSGTVTSLLYSLELNNSTGLSITHINQVACRNIIFYSGSITTGSGSIDLGDDASAVSVQYGDPTTPSTGGGNFNVSPVFKLASGSLKLKYYKESTARITGFEIPSGRAIDTLEINNNSSTLTLSGGNLTINRLLTLSTGRIITDASNSLTLASTIISYPTGSANSFVSGPLKITLTVQTGITVNFAIGDGTKWRPVVISSFNSSAATYTAESFNLNSGGTPLTPLVVLNRARYFRIQGTIPSTATIQLSYGNDDLVGATGTARVAQSTNSGANYSSVGGATASTPTTGIVSTSTLVTGEYFIIGNEAPYTITWNGNTGNWGDVLNWTPNVIPISTDNVVLTSSGTATINLNTGSSSVGNLNVTAGTLTLNLSSNTLTVDTNYSQSGGTLSVNGGTFDFKKDFTITSGGTYTATSGITKFSAIANSQNISGATFYDLLLTGGSASYVKNFTATNTFTVSNNFNVEKTAKMALSSANATSMIVAGDFIYGGVAGGSNIVYLTLNLTGVGKNINGSATDSYRKTKENITEYNKISDKVIDFSGKNSSEKYLNTYENKKEEIDRIISSQKPDERLIIVLDDRTMFINPQVKSDEIDITIPSFDFNITVASSGNYTALDKITFNTGTLLKIDGRLQIGAAAPSLSGDGTLQLSNNGILGITSTSNDGGRNTINIVTQTYIEGSIIDYCALGDQYIRESMTGGLHPVGSMVYTSGSGTKSLYANLILNGTSGQSTYKNVLNVGAGTTLSDAGFAITLGGQYANVKILGTYNSTGSGQLLWNNPNSTSSIIAKTGTVFGDIKLCDRNILLKAADGSSSNITFRNFSTDSAGGGILYLDDSGHTPVTITGNISINPDNPLNSGGGFDAKTGASGYVLVQGNYTSTSTNASQYLIGNTGTNVIEFSNTSTQTVTCGAATTIVPANATLRINNTSVSGVQFDTRTYTITGTLEIQNTSKISGTGTPVGSIVYSGASSKLMFTGSGNLTTTDAEFPNAPNGPAQFTVDKTNTGDKVTLHANRSFNGNITLTKGILAIGGASGDDHTLTINSGFVYTPGNATLEGGTFSNLTFAAENAGAATLPGVTLKNLEINRTAGVTMAGDVTINGTTTITQGHLYTSSNKVIFNQNSVLNETADGATINGNAETTTWTVGAVNFNFLGISWTTSTYNPATVKIIRTTGTPVPGYLGVKVYWDITVGTQPSSGLSVTYSWFKEYNNGNDFPTRPGGVWRSTTGIGGPWAIVDVLKTVTGADKHIITISTTEFSFWSVSDDNHPLSVELASFTSSIIDRDVKLDWRTTEEINNSGFDIERATYNPKTPENQAWSKISFVEAKQNPTGSNYSYNDRKLNTGKYLYRLKQIDYNGNHTYYPLKNEVVIGIPKKYDLSQNYPNPFNPVTKIDYNLPYDSKVSIKIYDMVGREVMTLLNEQKPAGFYTLEFNGINLASGAYFYRIIADHDNDKFITTKKMMLVK